MSQHTAWVNFKAVVEEFEALLRRAATTKSEVRLKALLQLLSRLELACLDLPDLSPDEAESESPNTYDLRRAAVASAFPEFGFYNTVRPSPVSEHEELCVGDAVDDLADILRDVDDALWTERAQGETNAIWQAKFNYEHHLGSHLADLRAHVYCLRFFGP